MVAGDAGQLLIGARGTRWRDVEYISGRDGA